MNKPSIFKHFISIGTGTVINMLVGFLTTPVLTRLVGTAEYGQYSIFTMYASIALMILCMGFDQALIRYFYGFEHPQSAMERLLWSASVLKESFGISKKSDSDIP